MKRQAGKNDKKAEKKIKESKRIQMDLSNFFEFQPESFEVNYSKVFYSNEFNLKLSSTEAIIDFIQLPGEKSDNKMKIDAVRIYLPYGVGKDLVDIMQVALKNRPLMNE